MDNFTDDLEKKQELDTTSRMKDFISDIKPAVPDFVTKTKEYLKQHPGAIREVAGDEITAIEKWLDTLPMGLGEIGKTKLNEFLGGASGRQEGVKDAPGQTFIPSDIQRGEEEIQTEPEDAMTTQDVKDLLDFIAELSEQGFSLPEIADAVWRDYRIEYHPLKIKRMLKSYYGRPETDDDEEKGTGSRSQSLRIYQKLLEKNSALLKKVAELTAKLPPEIINPVRKGLIRRFLGWIW